MKHEWKKREKELYLPSHEPVEIIVPEMNYFCISGRGNPNDPAFGEYIQALYSLSYGVRMSYKSVLVPPNSLI